MVTHSTDIEMKEDLEFADTKEEAAYWRQMAEEYVQKLVCGRQSNCCLTRFILTSQIFFTCTNLQLQ